MPFPAHEATTCQLAGAYPFVTEEAENGSGILVGEGLLGGRFRYDPFLLYKSGALTNPNVVIFGQIGRGKSSLVKTYLWRQANCGRRSWVIDPKGEYRGLAGAYGVEPIELRPDGPVRLNPLEGAGGKPSGEDPTRKRTALLAALAAASLGRALQPPERAAIDVAVGELSAERVPTLPVVVEALLRPSFAAARALGTDRSGLAVDGRDVALELRRLVSGDLRGMFDGPTSRCVDLDAGLVVLDLSSVYHSAALGILMTCTAAWLEAALSGARSEVHGGAIVVVDEAWAVLANLEAARWLQSFWKLSRAWGVSNVAVLHRVSDLDSAGAVGSEQRSLARGLLADSETRVVFAQAPDEVPRATAELGLSETEAGLLSRLRRGVALWKVGQRSFLVRHALSPYESEMIDTDSRMSGATVSSGIEDTPAVPVRDP